MERMVARARWVLVWGLMGLSSPVVAQLVPTYVPTKTQCCSAIFGQRLADSLKDWPQIGRYYEDDQRLMATAPQPGRVVFLGDSITDFWNLSKYFPGRPYINRGISGQTTAQMLLRVFPDVIRLRPTAVILLAGTNDIAGNTGPVTLAMVEENIRAITELARLHHVKVILCTLTPVSDYTRFHQTTDHPPSDILHLNEWIKSYAREIHAPVADYYSALVDSAGMLRDGFSSDGLHPNDTGYELLAPVASKAIQEAQGSNFK